MGIPRSDNEGWEVESTGRWLNNANRRPALRSHVNYSRPLKPLPKTVQEIGMMEDLLLRGITQR
jgi:hypothetical protein